MNINDLYDLNKRVEELSIQVVDLLAQLDEAAAKIEYDIERMEYDKKYTNELYIDRLAETAYSDYKGGRHNE